MELEQLLDQAAAALAARRYDEAIALCRRVLESDMNNFRAHALWSCAVLPGEGYMAMLQRIHRHLQPRTYVEIGVETGRSLALAQSCAACVGIDPQPQLSHPIPDVARVFVETSDAFFAQHDLFSELGGRPVDLAFLDGMHLFGFALRDFVNVERYCTPHSTCLVHDCYPLDENTSGPDRGTRFWSGDVWKLILCLKKYRPDLEVHTIAAPPTGLAVIRGLDPGSTMLRDRMDRIRAEFEDLPYSVVRDDKNAKLNLVRNDWPTVQALLGSPLEETIAFS
jgi:Methyltransferase domain